MYIHKNKVKKNFSAAAASYDRRSGLQFTISRELLSFLGRPRAHRIIDIGSGTGRLLDCLVELFPGAELHGFDLAYGMVRQSREMKPMDSCGRTGETRSAFFLQADAEKLPYRSASFDLVLSNAVYQWIPDLTGAFQEVYRILKPKGIFCFSTFREGTLAELNSSFHMAYRKLNFEAGQRHVQSFPTSRDLADSLEKSGFSSLALKERTMLQYYPDAWSLIRHLKAAGASKAIPHPFPGLGGRKIIEEMINSYHRHFQNGKGIQATYQIVLARGERQ
ncbi:MAG: methyltransferase domain-containing protein [bacterium]